MIESQMSKADPVILHPIAPVSIIVPTFNEEKHIGTAMKTIASQSVIKAYPDMFEIILIDSGSTDNTVAIATEYADVTLEAPRGKLTARNMATEIAKGDIIVSVDGDTHYNDNWLNTLLKPFYDPDVVATTGSTYENSIPLVSHHLVSIWGFIQQSGCPVKLTGRNCAYYKSVFYESGAFSENINQQAIKEMLWEEEYGFKSRMEQFGKVVYVPGASCVHLGGSKVGCRIGTEAQEVCELSGIGTERF